jgi:hypothetical protein
VCSFVLSTTSDADIIVSDFVKKISFIVPTFLFVFFSAMYICAFLSLFRVRVSQATVLMISSLLKDSSDGLDAVSVQMITGITYKTLNLITIYKFARNSRLDRYSYVP